MKVNRTLTKLYIERNEIGSAGAVSLAEALKVNGTLTVLNLTSNQLGDAGAVGLSEMLKVNRTLAVLDLQYNGINDDGQAKLHEALNINSTLTELPVNGNPCQYSPISLYSHLQENIRVQKALPYAAVSLELASNLSYPAEVMVAIIQQMAALPASRREAGRATIESLSGAVQPLAQSN